MTENYTTFRDMPKPKALDTMQGVYDPKFENGLLVSIKDEMMQAILDGPPRPASAGQRFYRRKLEKYNNAEAAARHFKDVSPGSIRDQIADYCRQVMNLRQALEDRALAEAQAEGPSRRLQGGKEGRGEEGLTK